MSFPVDGVAGAARQPVVSLETANLPGPSLGSITGACALRRSAGLTGWEDGTPARLAVSRCGVSVWGPRDGMNTYAGGLGALRKAIKMAVRLTEINLCRRTTGGGPSESLQHAARPLAAGDHTEGNSR